MKVIYTDEASKDLDGILAYIASNYPTVYEPFLIRLRSVTARIGMWPDSAQEVAEEPGVRVVPCSGILIRYFIGTPERRSRSCTSIMPRGTNDGASELDVVLS
jgi:plasmid stabilization system protein ParE